MKTDAMKAGKNKLNPLASGTRAHVRGVTLIETVCVLAVIGVVSAIGMPSLRGTLSNSHATVVGDRLLTDLARARSEAIMSRMPSVVCPSVDGSTCTKGTDWSNGWIVFVDRDGDDQRSAIEPVLSVVTANDLGGLQVTTSVGRTKARFLPDGRSGGTNLSMHVCDGQKLARSVIINVVGRSRIEKPDSADSACDAVAAR